MLTALMPLKAAGKYQRQPITIKARFDEIDPDPALARQAMNAALKQVQESRVKIQRGGYTAGIVELRDCVVLYRLDRTARGFTLWLGITVLWSDMYSDNAAKIFTPMPHLWS